MFEAYAIGVRLTLQGNIGADLTKVGQQFDALNRIIGRSQMAVNELAAGMRGLSRVGQSAAAAWTQAANAMERAARAARSATGSMSGGAGGFAPQASNPAAMAGMVAAAAAVASANQRRLPAPQTGFTLPPGLPTGGGSVPLLPYVPSNIMPYTANGSFAGGPGTGSGGTALMATGGGAGGGGPIPLNLGGAGGGPGAPMPTHSQFATAAAGFGALGYVLMHAVEASVKARTEVEHLQAGIGLMGMTSEQVKESLTRATDLQRNVPGITIGGGLHIIKDLLAVTQNVHDALDPTLLRSFAQAGVVLTAGGKGNAIAELFKAMQAGELRGEFSGANGQPDPAKAAAFLQSVLATTIQTGGRVGPAEILQFIKSGGMGSAMLGNRDLFADAIAPIISMGSARAGTGIQAFAQQFSAGKMSDAGANMLLEMGLLQNMPGNSIAAQQAYMKRNYKVGIGQYRLPPDKLVGMGDPNTNPREHPIEFMERVLLPRIDTYNQQHYGAPRDDKDRDAQRMATGASVASRIPGGNILGDVIRNWPLIMRDREAIAEALKRGQNDGAFNQIQATDPKVKMEAFGAAMNGMLIALGGPIMDSAISAIKTLTTVLNAVSDFASKHPDMTKNIMLATAGVGAFSVAMAVLSGALVAVPAAWAVLRWLPTGMTALATSIATLGGANPAAAAAGGIHSSRRHRRAGPHRRRGLYGP